MGRLTLIATPIGNLEDLSLRARRVLGEVDALACEDTRHTRILLERFEIPRPAVVFSCNEHNERQAVRRIRQLLDAGSHVGLVTDAGCPGVSDPGYLAVQEALDGDHALEVLPGPSAVLTALAVSGLPMSSFTFLGFPPRGPGKRIHFLEAEQESPHTLVLFEAPTRLHATLKALAEVMGDRPTAVCIELTKMFEQIHRGLPADLADRFAQETVRGEVVIVVSGKSRRRADKPGDAD